MSWQQFGRLLRVLFLVRVPLVTLFFLAAFGPFAIFVAEALLGNILDQGRNPWYFMAISFSAFLLAFTAIAAINLLFSYGADRLEDPNLKLLQTHPVLTFILGSLPAVILLICTGARTIGLGFRWKLVLSVAGFAAAIALVIVAKLVQLALTDPSATPYPPPYLVFPAYLFSPLQKLFDLTYCWSSASSRRVKKGFNSLAQWPLQILQDAGQGYLVDGNPPPGEPLRLRSGHVFALSLAVIAFGFYLGIGYGKAYISVTPNRVPALAYLLLFTIVLCWTLGAFTFFLDRYRFPLLWILGVLSLITTFTPVSDHFFRVVPLDHRMDHMMSPAEFLRLRTATGHKRLVFVATAGGGIQASAWTVQVLTGLEEGCSTKQPPCQFRDSVTAISSVSGGSLGSMVYARSYSHQLPQFSPEQLRENATASALDEVAWGWTNPDVARAVSPWFWNREIDRGWALERKWAEVNGLRDTKTGFGDTLLSTWASEAYAGMPALIFNSMIVETGQPVVFSTSDFARKKNGRSLRNFYDLYSNPPYPDVRVATAVRLSASFPYVGPAARPNIKSPMAPDYHFVDGGYYDNYGINSLLEWLEDAYKDTRLRHDVPDILILQIRPFTVAAEPQGSRHGWGYQVSAPVQGLMKMRDTAQDARDATDMQLFARYNGSRDLHIWTARFGFPGKDSCAHAPLSWKLSEAQTKCITDSWRTLQESHDPMITCVQSYLDGAELNNGVCPDAATEGSGEDAP